MTQDRHMLVEEIQSALHRAFWNGVSAGHDLTPRHERERLEQEAKDEGLKDILQMLPPEDA